MSVDANTRATFSSLHDKFNNKEEKNTTVPFWRDSHIKEIQQCLGESDEENDGENDRENDGENDGENDEENDEENGRGLRTYVEEGQEGALSSRPAVELTAQEYSGYRKNEIKRNYLAKIKR